MISVDEAFSAYDRTLSPLAAREAPLEEALGRVLAEEARAAADLPPFPQSAMDGYALRAADTEGATDARPARLALTGAVPAGQALEGRLEPGRAVRIYTGSPLPPGADAVLRQERAREEDGEVVVPGPVEPGRNVRPRGEDMEAGTPLAEPGARLTAGHLAGLAAGGVDAVAVRPAPRVTLVVTGDELVEPGRELGPGQVYEANSRLVGAWLRHRGVRLTAVLRAADRREDTLEALERALEQSDLVLSSGGVSVGDRDYVLEAAREAGVERAFWKVAQKPGKPLFFGLRGRVPLLGLPGNPGSVHACLVTHARRVLDLLEGAAQPGPRFRPGRLRRPFRRDPRRTWWARCALEVSAGGRVELEPLESQASHRVAALGRCHAVARVEAGDGSVGAGEDVSWVPAAGARCAVG